MWYAPDSIPASTYAQPAGTAADLPPAASLPGPAQPAAPAPSPIASLYPADPGPAVDLVEAAEAALRLEEERQSDALAFAGPSSAAQYQFDRPYGATPNLESELAFREFLFDEAVPVSIAKEVDRQAMLGAAKPPSPVQLELDRQQGMIALERIWGADRDANLDLARQEVARLAVKRPEIVTILESTGLGNSHWLALTLVNLARAKGRGAK